MDARTMRARFGRGLLSGLRVVWPILSVLLALMITMGIVVGLREGWSLHESIYFSFVTGLTIGYGDLAPKSLMTRALAIAIFSAYMLYDLKQIIDGGETNYISATLAVYLDLYNVFVSLLQLIMAFTGERD